MPSEKDGRLADPILPRFKTHDSEHQPNPDTCLTTTKTSSQSHHSLRPAVTLCWARVVRLDVSGQTALTPTLPMPLASSVQAHPRSVQKLPTSLPIGTPPSYRELTSSPHASRRGWFSLVQPPDYRGTLHHATLYRNLRQALRRWARVFVSPHLHATLDDAQS